jgi:hypothetical protein
MEAHKKPGLTRPAGRIVRRNEMRNPMPLRFDDENGWIYRPPTPIRRRELARRRQAVLIHTTDDEGVLGIASTGQVNLIPRNSFRKDD